MADRLLLLLLIASAAGGIFLSREALSQSSEVLIERDGRPVYVLPLNGDRSVRIDGPYGPTVIEVKAGKVRVKEAGCPNRDCVREGWISRGVIVCLPNRIVVTVGGRSSPDPRGLDAVTG